MTASTNAYPPLPKPDASLALFEELDAFSEETLKAFADATFELRIARAAGAVTLPAMPEVSGLARLRGELVRKADADARCAYLALLALPQDGGPV